MSVGCVGGGRVEVNVCTCVSLRLCYGGSS